MQGDQTPKLSDNVFVHLTGTLTIYCSKERTCANIKGKQNVIICTCSHKHVIKTVVVRRGSLCTKCWHLWLIKADSADSVWWSQAEVVTLTLLLILAAHTAHRHPWLALMEVIGLFTFLLIPTVYVLFSFIYQLTKMAPPVCTEFDILMVIMRPHHVPSRAICFTPINHTTVSHLTCL